MSYTLIYPPAETVLEMEPEELAPFVLRFLNQGDRQQLNMHNFSLGSGTEFIAWAGENQQRRQEVLQRLILAWRWLENQLFIAPAPGNNNWSFITHRGLQVLESVNFEAYRMGALLSSDNLDPILVRKVKPAFIRGDYDVAVFQAFKEVEVRVRAKAGLGAGDIGVSLMRSAFNPERGSLTAQTMEGGEKVARMELFSGAIGTYKNPNSHRNVELGDPAEAATIINFANLLLKIVDSIEINEQ